MLQKPYVDETGKPYQQKDPKRIILVASIGILVLLIIIFIVIAVNNSAKTRKCRSIREVAIEAAIDYAEENELLPTIDGMSVTVEMNDLIAGDFLEETEVSMKSNTCGGSIKLTKMGEEYFGTPYLTNCDYCSTGDDWSDEQDSVPSKNKIVDVVAYYNYVTKETNYTEWTKYYTPEQLEKDPFLEVTDDRFRASIPSDAKNIEIETDTLNYYRYRDLRYKYYRVNNNNYSTFSSEQPEGYANKDTNTARETEWSEWSLTAPDKKDYRTIDEDTGYRWYYMDGKTKVYWNSGAYYPEQPDEQYTEREKEGVDMFRYKDTEWRWYNGERRQYSGWYATMPHGYYYRDDELSQYGSWSSWSTASRVDSSNESYREEEIEVRSRYRLKYDMYSFHILSDFVKAEEFESASGKTIQEVLDDPTLELIVEYKYIYQK